MRTLALFAAVLAIAGYVFVALARLSYPFELEWLEGGSLEHVNRVLEGRALYASPSLEFTAFIYPPLYYWVAALPAAWLGPGFFPLRLTSVVASLACLGLVFTAVSRETGGRFAATLAAGLFAACFRASGAWLDLARVDSLFLGLLLAAVLAGRLARSVRGELFTVLLLILAFFTKQAALPCAFALGALLWRRSGARRAALFLGSFLVLAGAGVALLQHSHEGWFLYYTLRPHPLLWGQLLRFWTRDLAAVLPVALGLAALSALDWKGEAGSGASRFWWAAAAALIATSLGSRLIAGAYLNVLLPAYAGVAILFGLGVHAALARIGPALDRERQVLRAALFLAVLLQFAALAYDPRGQIPTRADREAGERLVREIAAIPGQVLIPYHPYLLPMAGKPAHAHHMAIDDIALSGDAAARALHDQLENALRQRRYAAVILDPAFSAREAVEREYRLARRLLEDEEVLWPRTGARLRPERLYLPGSPEP